jgi:hypothetical protein
MDQLDFTAIDAADNRRVKARNDAVRAAQFRARVAAVVLVVIATVIGAAAGATGCKSWEAFLSSAVGGLLGVPAGLTVSVLWGTMAGSRVRPEHHQWYLLATMPDDLIGFFWTMFTVGRSTGAMKISADDLLLVFVASSIPISAAVGADIGNPFAVTFSWQSWVGAFTGSLFAYLLAYFLFRHRFAGTKIPQGAP